MPIGIKIIFLCLIASGAVASPPLGEAMDPSQTETMDLRRAFLERYLDCAEAPSDDARLACYDALLADIPDWLDAFETAGITGDLSDPTVPKVHVLRIDPGP